MLMGKWIVSYQWIIDSQKNGEWLDESNYEIIGDNKTQQLIKGGPKKARLLYHGKNSSSSSSSSSKRRRRSSIGSSTNKEKGSLFNGITMYVDSNKTKLPPTTAEYIHLLRLGDGRVMQSLSCLSKLTNADDNSGVVEDIDDDNNDKKERHILVCDQNGPPRSTLGLIDSGKLVAVDGEWALDSISNFTLMDVKEYPARSRGRGGGRSRS